MHLDGHENHFLKYVLPKPQPYWTAKKLYEEFKTKSDSSEYLHENDFANSIWNNSSNLLEIEEVVLNSKTIDIFTCDYNKTCSEIDDWFNNQLKNSLKTRLKNNQLCKNEN